MFFFFSIVSFFVFFFFFYANIFFIKNFVIVVNLSIYIFSILFFVFYDSFYLTQQFIYFFSYVDFFFVFGLDGISILFIFLTSFLFSVCFLFNYKNMYLNMRLYIITLFLLEILLLFVFSIQDFFLFYIAFEAILLPIFLFIGIFGSRKRKIHAGYLLFFYTFFGSLLMLLTFLLIFSSTGSFYFDLLSNSEFSFFKENFIFLSIFFSFAIKVPMFPFHIWLPEAHVEAPTEGSVILAGVLLKLGGYGFLRISIPIFFKTTLFFIPFIFLICILGIVYTSFITLRQHDLKKIVAYSSIAHMNIAIAGLFSFDFSSIIGSFLVFLSHGFISGSLFFLIGILYEKTKTRELKYYSGLVYLMPLTSFFFFIFIISNISIPGSLSFIGEFLILSSLFFFSKLLFFVVLIGIFICTIYSLLLFTKLFYGIINYNYIYSLTDLIRLEFNIFIPNVFFILFYGLFPSFLIKQIELSLVVSTLQLY